MARRKLDKPTKSMRDAAWRALHEVVVDPGAADHARVSAARALVRDDPEAAEAAEAAATAERGPPSILILPTNHRDPVLAPLGITRGERSYLIIYDGATEDGLVDLECWKAEVHAEIDAAFPPAKPALPAPVKIKLTGTEQKRRWRAKVKARQAAKQLPALSSGQANHQPTPDRP